MVTDAELFGGLHALTLACTTMVKLISIYLCITIVTTAINFVAAFVKGYRKGTDNE